jgi:hypothetical protein
MPIHSGIVARKTVCNYACQQRRVCESCGDCWCRHTVGTQVRMPNKGWTMVKTSRDNTRCTGFWEGGGG